MQYTTLNNILEALDIKEVLNTSFKDEIKIINWDTEDTLFSSLFKRGYAWYIIEGGIVTTSYFNGEKELFWKIKKGKWLGLPDAVLNDFTEHDIKILRGTMVLELPLHDLLMSREVSKDFYRKILIEFAKTVKPVIRSAAMKIKCGDELYFLEYLRENNYDITFKSIKDLSELLNINLRTFHRSLKKMTERKIISKDTRRIKVIDFDAFESYLQELTSD